MWKAVDEYFHSGRRVCLVGAFTLDETRDRFAKEIKDYFARWVTSLRRALVRAGADVEIADGLAEEAVLGIQGALVLARAVADDGIFARAIARLAANLNAHVLQGTSSNPSAVQTRDTTRGHKRRKA
jgi:AcrR family transcriptional regulator